MGSTHCKKVLGSTSALTRVLLRLGFACCLHASVFSHSKSYFKLPVGVIDWHPVKSVPHLSTRSWLGWAQASW